jgi:hypothetical protein
MKKSQEKPKNTLLPGDLITLQLPRKTLRIALVLCCPNRPDEMLWILTKDGIEQLSCKGGWRAVPEARPPVRIKAGRPPRCR